MRLLAATLVCVLGCACGSAPEPPQPLLSNTAPLGEPGQPAELEPQTARAATEFTGTGEAFDGPFRLADESLTMTAAGEFTRVRRNGAVDGGTYLVTADGLLVLYVERIGDARLTTVQEEVHDRADLQVGP